MAKKRDRIPKRIAGVKTPKKLRKSKVLRGLLGSPAGREILASALTAGAGAAAAALMGNREGGARTAGGARRSGALGVVSEALQEGAGAILQAVTGAARAGRTDPPAPAEPPKPGAPDRKDAQPAPEEPRH